MADTPRTLCKAKVYERDTYRRTGRGKSGFSMHYTLRQCKRFATAGDYCHQHRPFDPAMRKQP